MEERDIVIIGTSPAGLSAAIFTQLDGWSTLVLEDSCVDGQGANAWTVSNYPGFPSGDGAVLMGNMEEQVTSAPPAGVGAKLRHERVASLNAEDRIVITEINEYKAQAIILATNSIMQKRGVLGEDRFAGKGVYYYTKCATDDFAGKSILVVCGGNTTAKSILLAKSGASDFTLIHRRESLRTYPVMTGRLQKEGVQIWYNTELMAIKGSDRADTAVVINNTTGEQTEIEIDWIVICIGKEPDTRLAREAGLEMNGNFVAINSRMMTHKPGIFACGEITGGEHRFIAAVSEGASAGMAASEYLAQERVRGVRCLRKLGTDNTLTNI